MIIDGVKQCELCKKKKYTSYFANDEHFEDKKLPVCIKCSRKDAGVEILHASGYSKECKDCGLTLSLADFSVVGVRAQNTLPHLSKKCKECSAFDFSKVL